MQIRHSGEGLNKRVKGAQSRKAPGALTYVFLFSHVGSPIWKNPSGEVTAHVLKETGNLGGHQALLKSVGVMVQGEWQICRQG